MDDSGEEDAARISSLIGSLRILGCLVWIEGAVPASSIGVLVVCGSDVAVDSVSLMSRVSSEATVVIVLSSSGMR